MKKILIILLAFSSASFSQNITDEVIQYFDNQIADSQSLRQKNALIKSQDDLNFYSSLKDSSFPLNILDKNGKKIFTDSLRFNETGLTTFDYTTFNNLSADSTYKILSLFGAEHLSRLIHESKFLRHSTDHIGYKCVSRANCKKSGGFICMASC